MQIRILFLFLFLISFLKAQPASAFATNPPENADVVIIGAGLSGLSSAFFLKEKKLNYHVLELSPRVGGRVRTIRYKVDPSNPNEEISVDAGMEEYWESNPAVELLKKLKLETTADVAASSIVLNGKLQVLGKEEDSAAFRKRVFNKAEAAAYQRFEKSLIEHLEVLKKITDQNPLPSQEIEKNLKLKKLISISFSKWVEGFHLSKKVSDWIRISLECEVGTTWNLISALDGIAEMHIFPGSGEKSYRVVGGNEKFISALVDAVGENNISLNKKVGRVVRKENGESWIYYQDTSSGESHFIKAKAVISTVPLFKLFEIQFEPTLSPSKRNAIDSQSHGDYFKVHVFVDKKAESFWTKNEESILPILSDSELGVIYDGSLLQEKTRFKVLSLLVSGPFATAFSYMNYDLVRETVKRRFELLWPGFSKSITGMEMFRLHPKAIAGWPVGRSRFDALSDEIRRPENGVHIAGDFTESSHSDGAFKSARRAVDQILQNLSKTSEGKK